MEHEATATLVESIPSGMEDLLDAETPLTVAAFIRLIDSAEYSIHISAMYWTLRPTNKEGEFSAWSVAELVLDFGADEGNLVYDSLKSAASRGVEIRILQAAQFGDPNTTPDSSQLQAEFPNQVEVREIDVAAWFGQGVLHQKIIIVDESSFYVGSANMDWRSFTQVKELGIVVEHCSLLAGDLGAYFEAWWVLSTQVPQRRRPTMLAANSYHSPPKSSWGKPLFAHLNGGPGTAIISGSPEALCAPPRISDADLIVRTLRDAASTICINVMDFAPINVHPNLEPEGGPLIWWPEFTDAILDSVISRGVDCRLLVSEWFHTSIYVAPFLAALQCTYLAARSNSDLPGGDLQIRRFRVPGWDATANRRDGVAKFPGHTRVNHVKYLVTDRRVNIGTSNWTFDYFHGTAGVSINLDHIDIVKSIQRLFDRDWSSGYSSTI